MINTQKIVLDTMTDLVIVVASNGEFCWVSPTCYKILGYTQAEMTGHNGEEFVHPADLPGVRVHMKMGREDGEEHQFECRYVAKDGTDVALWWSGNWSKPLKQHVYTGRDVTGFRTLLRLKDAEAALESIQEYLIRHKRRSSLQWWSLFEIMLILGSVWASYALLMPPSNFDRFPDSYALARAVIDSEMAWGLIAAGAALTKALGLAGTWLGDVNISFLLSVVGLCISGVFWIFMGTSYMIGNPDSLFVMTGGIVTGIFALIAAADRVFR